MNPLSVLVIKWFIIFASEVSSIKMKSLVYLILLIHVSGNFVDGKLEYFTDDFPADYNLRTNLADCPRRFYSDPNKYNLPSIHGGVRAIRGEFPHMAAIGWTTPEGIKYLCGGSLISPKFVLTAAHCASNGEGIPPDTIRLGDIDISLTSLSQFSQQIKIKSFKKHPQHRFSRKYFDIALIELEREALFNGAVCPACLWLEKYAPSEPMVAIGFGTTGYGEDLSPTLLKAKLSEMNKEVCFKRLPKDLRTLPNGLVEEQLCAASDHQDTCEGDSGGPLQVERVDVSKMVIPLIVGVVSFGTPCTNGSTGVYTRVASYKEWIEQETGQSFDYSTCARSSGCSSRKRVRSSIDIPPYYPANRVGLLWNETDSNKYRCGATLVDYKFALTSAYCVNSNQGFPKFIIVESTREIIPIVKVHVHPMYTLDKPENDLALLELAKYLKRDSWLLPACLWRNENENDTFEDMRYSVHSSFGTVSSGFVLSTNIDQNGKCVHKFHQERNLFCGSNPLKFIPTVCKMDYGGPILTIVQHLVDMDLVFLHGVVSSLNKECDKILVGTRVAPHVTWIEEVVLGVNSDQFIFSP